MTARHLATLGLEALDVGLAPVEFLMRDGAVFSGPLTYVCDDYAILGGLGFPVEEIVCADLLAPRDVRDRVAARKRTRGGGA